MDNTIEQLMQRVAELENQVATIAIALQKQANVNAGMQDNIIRLNDNLVRMAQAVDRFAVVAAGA